MADPEQTPQDLLEYAAGLPDLAADNNVGRAANLLGAARGGLVSSVLAPLAGASRVVGNTENANALDAILREQQAPGGLLPTNPAMANDFSTGVARGVGAAPVLALTAVGGLPALVGTGALSGIDAYNQQKAGYDARAAAGQLQEGEAPPSPVGQVAKGAIGNAAFLLGGGAAGQGLKYALPSIEGPIARAATAYGGTVAGNLLGSALARKAETGSFGYENPAAAGEDVTAAALPFGITPARHLLAGTPFKPRTSLPDIETPTEKVPALSLNPISEGLAKAALPPDEKAPAAPAPVELPTIGGDRTLEPTPPLAETPVPAEVQPTTPPELPSNETRNVQEQVNGVQPVNGPDVSPDEANDAQELLRGQRELGPSTQEGGVLQPGSDQPVDQVGGSVEQLRGQGELGSGSPERPVLSPVPESPQTLVEQQKQLVAGTRPAMLFTPGETELPLPPGMWKVTTDNGTYHFNPDKLNAPQVRLLDSQGRQNEILGLGPENKEDVQKAPGTPVVVTERTPEGTEVKAAAASEGQAPATAQELEENKTPGNTVQTETPAQVVENRQIPPHEQLRTQIDDLDQQIADVRKAAFEPGTRKPLPGEDAAKARESLMSLEPKRADLSQELANLAPESPFPVEPQSPAMQARAQQAKGLHEQLADIQAQRKAAEAVVDSLRPEGGKDLVDEDGNTVEREPNSAEDREAFRDAKGEVSQLKRQEAFWKQKIAENDRKAAEPIAESAAPSKEKSEVHDIAKLAKISGVDETRLTKFESEVKGALGGLEKEASDLAPGADVFYTDTTTGAPTAVVYSDGRFGIHVPPRWAAEILAVAKGNELKARAEVRKVYDHELSHLLGWKILADEHDRISNNPAGRFQYISTKLRNILTETNSNLRRLRDSGQHSKAFAIENGFRAAVEAYDGKPGTRSGRQLIDDMIANPAESWKYANELVRQFDELNQKKQLTESFIQRVYRPLSDFVKQTRDQIKNLLGATKAGEVSDTLKRLIEQIDAVRTGKTEKPPSLVVKPDARSVKATTHLEDNTIPWYGQSDEDLNARANSRGGSSNPALAAAQGELSSDGASNQLPIGSSGRTRAELDRLAGSQPERLIDGSSILRNNREVKGGAEHRVLLAPEVNRVIKLTRGDDGSAGGTPRLFEAASPDYDGNKIGLQNANPSEYLDRIRLSNEVFGDDQQYHGVWLDKNGDPKGLVISQPFIDGPEATQAQADNYLQGRGFKQLDTNTWYQPETNVLIDDTGARNFRVRNGKVVPIDIPIKVATPAEATDAQRTIASQPAIAGEASAPKFIEKAKQSLAEKTKEGRYLFGKSYRGYEDTFWKDVDRVDTQANQEGNRTGAKITAHFADIFGHKIADFHDAGPELNKELEAAFALREHGFSDAVTPEDQQAARDSLAKANADIAEGLKSDNYKVREAMEALKPRYDHAQEIVDMGGGKAEAAATVVGQKTNQQLAELKAMGKDPGEAENYIRRLIADDPDQGADKYVPNVGGAGGASYDKGFKNSRRFDTAVEAAQDGHKVAQFNVAKLLGATDATIAKLRGDQEFTDRLKQVNAPVTGRPVIIDSQTRYNPRKGIYEPYTPEGYTEVQGPGGQRITVEQNVAPLFNVLAAPSFLRQSFLGRGALQLAANIKHGTLLFDSYHGVRQAAALAGLLGQRANLDSIAELHRFIKKGLATADIAPEDLDAYVKSGVITEGDKAYALQNQKSYQRLIEGGLNAGKQLDNLYEQIGKPFFNSILNLIPTGGGKGLGDRVEQFNKYIFQKQARGAMVIGGIEALERNESRFPNKTPEEVARITAREMNELFGNLGRQGILKTAGARDLARLLVMAPQWNEGRIRFQGRAVGQLGRFAGNLVRGRPEALGNAGGTLLALAAGALAANQVTNLITTGKPTWENPDGHKLDAFIPGGKNGFYYSPLNLAAEDIHTIMKYGATNSPLDVAKRIALNKGSALTRAGAALAGIGPTGRPLPTDVGRLSQAAKSLLPVPIFASPLVSPILQPELSQKGDLLRQGLGMAGIKVDRAEGPEQRLRQIANNTLPNAFPKAESPGDYSKLRSFVGDDNTAAAKKEILDLVAKGKTEDQIRKAFSPDRSFTTSKQADALLMRNQTARALLAPAHQSRVVDFQALNRAIAAAKSDPKYSQAVLKGRQIKAGIQ